MRRPSAVVRWTPGYQIGAGRSLPEGAIDTHHGPAHDEGVEEMQGRTALVTGATGGIGTEIARGLVARGADVIITARDTSKGEEVRAELATAGPGTVEVLHLDVADQASVRTVAQTVRDRTPRLDVLVNNAGAWYTDRRESPDGIELTLATNVLGPHLLTALLLDRLAASEHARVVNVGSSVAGNLDLTDLQYARRPYDGFKAYAQSKQALAMLTWALAERLQSNGRLREHRLAGLRQDRVQPQRQGCTGRADRPVGPAVRDLAGEGGRLSTVGGHRVGARRGDRPVVRGAQAEAHPLRRGGPDRRAAAAVRRPGGTATVHMSGYDAAMMRVSWLLACLCCVVVLAGVGVGVFFAIRASQRKNQ